MGSTGRRSVTGMTLTAFVNAHVVPVAAEPFDGTLLVEDGRGAVAGPDVDLAESDLLVDHRPRHGAEGGEVEVSRVF